MDKIKQLEDMISAGKLSDALDFIESMPQEERQQWQVQNLTGAICSYCGQFPEAETFFSAAMGQQPDDVNVIFNLADTCAALGKREKAESLLRRCEQQDSKKELAEDIALLRKKLASPSGAAVAHGPKYLVICNGGYPTEGNPRCMFAHQRVLQYLKVGLNVEAFGFIWGAPFQKYEYQGVQVTQGGAPELQKVLQSEHYEKLLIHFVDNRIIYAIQQAGKLNMPMVIWCHGYEALKWSAYYNNYSKEEIIRNKRQWEAYDATKEKLLSQIFLIKNIQFVFVSNWMKENVKKCAGIEPLNYSIIPNFIDCDFYNTKGKYAQDRLKILSVKSQASRKYSSDLTAKAIIELSSKEFFPDLEFSLFGDGALFEENFGSLIKCAFPNVHIFRRYLNQSQMKSLYAENGIFLSPTRLDSQGVSACEAMSAGLAVISCNTAAIPEFMDEDCGSLYEFDNYFQLADEIEYLYYHPEEFLRKSRNAVKRVREQCGYDATIRRELDLITGA